MTWSYNTSLPDAQDQARFYSGDTDSAAAITLSDEEVLGAIALTGTVRAGAALMCDHLAQRYSTQGKLLRDDLAQQIDYGERAAFFRARAAQLRLMDRETVFPISGAAALAAVW